MTEALVVVGLAAVVGLAIGAWFNAQEVVNPSRVPPRPLPAPAPSTETVMKEGA